MKFLLAALGLILGVATAVSPTWADGRCETSGLASYYCCEHHGRKTASGERFNENAMTAAMPDRRRMGERWRVSYRGRSVTVRINDFGPHASLNRVIDLSKAAFAKLAPTSRGVIRVCLERVN